MSAPVSIYTPTIEKMPATIERKNKYLDQCYAKLPFALPNATAQKQLAEREKNFAGDLLNEVADEPVKVKRRVR